ncbi:MAG: hypothetical protein IJT91_00970 [Clostridia bacterium]|nr:hypothetical protein [Clostridia bacterium]
MKVLFIGNSHTYFHDMPELFAEMVETTSGEKPEVTMLAYSGRELEWHRKEYFPIRFALMYGSYDYCVIQQAAHPFPPVDCTEKYLKELVSLCGKFNTVPVIFMTWAQKEHPENQQIMIDTYERLADENNCRLAPIGVVWEKVCKAYPDIELYNDDGGHAGPYGDFLIAAVLCHTIEGKVSPEVSGRGLDFKGGKDIDWESPAVCEDKYIIPVDLDKDKTDRILGMIR